MTKPPKRAEVLAQLVRSHRWTSGAELGVLHGHTTRHLLKTCPALRMLAVDTWQPGDPALDTPDNGQRRTTADNGYRSYADVDMDAAHRGVLDIAGEFPRRLQIMRMPTWQAAELVPSASLCFVFVDADHTAEGVERDIRAWAHTLKPNGWLLGHDWDHHSVASVIDRLLPWHDRLEGAVWAIPMEDVRL
jgi:SAM-dependent methyltransferase